MQKSFAALMGLFVAQGEAFRSATYTQDHPFVGEYADAEVIMNEEGSTHRARHAQAPAVGKYDSLVPKTIKPMPKHARAKADELFFGPTEAEQKLSADLEQYQRGSTYGRGRLGQTMGINNSEYGVWQATIYMGGQSQVTAIVDTAADLTIINDKKYNIQSRVDSGAASMQDTAVSIDNAGRKWSGVWATDDVCVSIGECATGHEFFYAKAASFGDDVKADGILGLARPNQPYFASPDTEQADVSKSLLNSLLDQKTISSFSTFFQKDLISWIDFGTPKDSQRREDPTTFSLNNDFFWSSSTRGVRFGDDDAKKWDFSIIDGAVLSNNGQNATAIYSVFDTSSQDAFITTAFWDSFLAQLFLEMGQETYTFENGYVMASCKFNYPDLYFDVEGHYLQMSADDYVEDVSKDVSQDLCKLHVRPIDAPFNIFGTALYLDYYVTHNYGVESNMQWSPSVDSKKSVIMAAAAAPETNLFAQKYETENVDDGELWALVVAGAITLIALGVWGWVVYKVYYEDKKYEAIVIAALGVGGVVVGAILFYVLYIVFLIAFLPGNELYKPAGGDPAYAKVKHGHEGIKMSHIIVGAIVAFALHKLCAKKEAKKQKKATPQEHQAFEIVNTLA